jgi:hypothetical protein
MNVDLLYPVLNALKRLLAVYVVDENNPHRALIVALGDRTEPLLTRSVPELDLVQLPA